MKKRNYLRRVVLVLLVLLLLLIPGDSAGRAMETEPVAAEKVPLGKKSGRIAPQTGKLFEM